MARRRPSLPVALLALALSAVDARAGEPEARTTSIEGRVRDPDGRGVSGVTIEARRTVRGAKAPGDAPTEVVGATRTASGGEFRIDGLAEESYELTFVPPEKFLQPRAVRLPGGARDVELRVWPAASAVVTVVDPFGKPVAGAPVRATPLEDAPSPFGLSFRFEDSSGTALLLDREGRLVREDGSILSRDAFAGGPTTDARGRVTIPGLDPLRGYRLLVAPPLGRHDVGGRVLHEWRRTDATIRLPGGEVVRGAVRDPRGKGLDFVQVTCRSSAGVKAAYVREDGSFEIRGVSAGRVEVSATLLGAPGAGSDAVRVEANAGAEDVVLVIDPGATLTVRPRPDAFGHSRWARRDPPHSIEARLLWEGRDGPVSSGASVEDGALVFRRIEPGRPWTLWIAWSEEVRGTLFESGESLEAGTRTVALEPGRPIVGVARRGPEIQPPVWTGPWGEACTASRGRVLVRGTVDPDGTFGFPPLPEGWWSVEVHSFGHGTRLWARPGETLPLDPLPRR